MREQTTILTLLQVTVPANTVLTVSAEVKILEILGIVSNPELVRAMNLSLSLMSSPSTTAATVCRQSISDSWLGNLRECLAHLV